MVPSMIENGKFVTCKTTGILVACTQCKRVFNPVCVAPDVHRNQIHMEPSIVCFREDNCCDRRRGSEVSSLDTSHVKTDHRYHSTTIMQQSRLKSPVFVASKVVHGFGRGSKKLGVPTANFEETVAETVKLHSGIYYGFAQLIHPEGSNHAPLPTDNGAVCLATSPKNPIYPAVFSLGYNPHFNDVTKRTLEVHILHPFDYDFYGSTIRICICGYIRPEKKFDSLQELIDTIHADIDFARDSLKNPEIDWANVIHNQFFEC